MSHTGVLQGSSLGPLVTSYICTHCTGVYMRVRLSEAARQSNDRSTKGGCDCCRIMLHKAIIIQCSRHVSSIWIYQLTETKQGSLHLIWISHILLLPVLSRSKGGKTSSLVLKFRLSLIKKRICFNTFIHS